MILEYKGISVYYTDEGKGDPVVFLHGFLENSTMWGNFIPILSKRNRIICIDLPGHGKTGCLGYIHTMEIMSDVVAAVLNYLKISESLFIGHSMGGYVALTFAEKNPNKLNGLCLMNSTAKGDTEEKQRNRDRAINAVKQNHKTFIRMAIVNLFRPKNRIVFSEKINQLTAEALHTPLQGIIAALEGMKIRKNLEFIWRTHPYKKMMVIGRKDPALDYASLIEQVKNMNVRIVEFPDGHMSHIENESSLLHELMHFIEN